MQLQWRARLPLRWLLPGSYFTLVACCMAVYVSCSTHGCDEKLLILIPVAVILGLPWVPLWMLLRFGGLVPVLGPWGFVALCSLVVALNLAVLYSIGVARDRRHVQRSSQGRTA